jgi:hypothetical protein
VTFECYITKLSENIFIAYLPIQTSVVTDRA